MTLVNDVTMEHPHYGNQDHHLPFFKGQKGFCPCSSVVLEKQLLNNYMLESFHNSELIRQGTQQHQIFNADYLLTWLKEWLSLSPGDMILLGAPRRVIEKKYLSPGSTYEVVLNSQWRLKSSFN